MKKILIILLIILNLTACSKQEAKSSDNNNLSIKGVWLSCYELDFEDKSEIGFTNNIKNILFDIKSKGFNTVFVHVRSHCDAYYSSKYFPTSIFIAGVQGKKITYDPLKIICYFSKIYNLDIHAWINPFRISTDTNIEALSNSNPAKKHIINKSNVVRQVDGGYYFNPYYKSVRKLIINGIIEILENYDIKGIHFDDYFYPTTDKKFDEKEYQEYLENNPDISLADFRRNNINKLISVVYKTVHKFKKIFGISPHCSFYYNYNTQYADIEMWCNSENFIDYIAPQIYFNFTEKQETEDNQPLDFKKCLEYWQKKARNTPIYIGLALYKCSDEKDFSINNDVIAKQINYIKNKNIDGFIIFSYSYFKKNKQETENIIKEIQA